MFDLKGINLVIDQLSEERGIPREKMLEAVEGALATAYKKEYGKRGQIVRTHFNVETGEVDFYQIKMVVDPSTIRMEEEESKGEDDERPFFNEEQHMFLDDAKRIKRDAEVDSEIVFPLEKKTDFGRIAAQTAKQVIMAKIREAERSSVMEEFGGKEGDIVSGIAQRVERGNLYIDLGRATGIMPYNEQIPGERFRPGERIRAYLFSVEEGQRGVFLRLSRSHPKFLEKLFELEVPELANETIVIKAIAREAGSRSKVAVETTDDRIDPVGALVGQRGVRVSTVTSELGGERIDIIEWSENESEFVEDSLSPAEILSVEMDEEGRRATVEVTDDQQSLAIGRGGQNVRLAAKLTGWSIDIKSAHGEDVVAETDGVSVSVAPEDTPSAEKEPEGVKKGETPEVKEVEQKEPEKEDSSEKKENETAENVVQEEVSKEEETGDDTVKE